MPSNPFNESIAQLVAAQVKAQLQPHLESLQYLEEFLGKGGGRANGVAAVSTAPRVGRPPGSKNRKGPRKSAASSAGPVDTDKFSNGTRVEFRLGRGSAVGTVTGIDHQKGSVYIQRDGTKTVFQRPAGNLILASGGSSAKQASAPRSRSPKMKLKTPAQRGDASMFSSGDHVVFKLGRGSARGTVTSVDTKKGSVFIRRDGTKTVFQRPAVNLVADTAA